MKRNTFFKLSILIPLSMFCKPIFSASVLYTEGAWVNESVESHWDLSFGKKTTQQNIGHWNDQAIAYHQAEVSPPIRKKLYTPIKLVNESRVSYVPASNDRPLKHKAVSKPSLPAYDPSLEIKLLKAVRLGAINQVKALLKQGAKGTYEDKSTDDTPLGLAVKMGRLDMVKVLHKGGVAINRRGNGNTSYLHVAAAHGHLSVAQYLIQSGIPASVRTSKNWTPLHHAARFGHAALVSYFLREGVNSKTRTVDGLTPKDLAINANKVGVANLL